MNKQVKKYLVIVGFELLTLVIITLIACGACKLQFLGRYHVGERGGMIWNTNLYSYNALAYIAGLVLFLGLSFFVYNQLLKKQIAKLVEFNIWLRLLIILIGAACCFGMLFAILIVVLYELGLAGDMVPGILIEITMVGWPVIVALFLAGDVLRKIKKKAVVEK